MAILNRTSFPILYFNPTAWPNKVAKNKFLLWPAYGFRIAAPVPRPHHLNLFQKYVLAMLQAGVQHPPEIGQLLGLSPELIGYILTELTQLNLSDEQGNLTKLGKEFLKQESLQNQELASGYIFQDPFTGKFWPRFVEQLEFAELEYDDKQRIYLLLGSNSSPRHERAFRVLFDKNICFPPKSEEIVEICTKHWNEVAHFKKLRSRETGETENNYPLTFPIQLSQIALISKQAIACFLTTYIYLPQSAQVSPMWQICDPFGLGQQNWFREIVEQQSIQDENLKNFIQDMFSDAQQANHEHVDVFTQNYENSLNQVYTRLPGIKISDEILSALADMELIVDEIRHTDLHVALGKIKDTITKFQIVLLSLFQYIQKQFPLDKMWLNQVLTNYDSTYNTKILDQTAKSLNFLLTESSQLPDCLRNVQFYDIQQICDHSIAETLPAQVIASLLATSNHWQHPLRSVANQMPDLLLKIADICEWHLPLSALNARHPTIAHVLDQADTVYQIVKILCEELQKQSR